MPSTYFSNRERKSAIGQLFAIADMQVHPGAAPNEVIKYMKLLAENFRFLSTRE